MKTIELSRKQLYDLIWSTPISKLTQQYALSNEGFKKTCKKFEIPMPQNGFWLKLKHNKKVKIEKLNPIFGGVDKIVLTIREDGNTVNVDQTPLTIRTKEIENAPKAPLIVPENLTKPDVITTQTKDWWNGKIAINRYLEDSKIVYPIRVGHDCKKRALLFMDAFTKLLRYRGHSWSKKYSTTGVLINTVLIEVDLREASRRISAKPPYSGTELEPIGELIFKIGKYSKVKEWRDGKTKIEELLARIMAKLEIYAEQENEWMEHSRLANLKREEEENRLAEIKKRKDDEVDKFNKLVALSEKFNKTILIRQYIEAEKQNAINTNKMTPEKQEWIIWATAKADWLDPLINKPDDILDAK